MRHLLRTVSTLSILPLIASCSTPMKKDSPSYAIGEERMPQTWSIPTSDSTQKLNWLASFNDETLQTLVDEAIENNFGLESANYKTNAAQAAIRISNSFRFPSVKLDLNSGRQQTRSSLLNYQATETDANNLSFGASWEIDLWNRLGKQKSAAKSQYNATVLDYRAFELSLTGQIARTWFNAIDAKSQLQLSKETTESLEANLKVLESRYERGLVTSFDLRLSRAQTASSRALEQQRKNALSGYVRKLETLLGRYPSGSLKINDALPEISEPIPAGTPSELLARRPDIAAAEQRLRASISLDAATQTNWLPSLSLTASAGTASAQFADLLDSNFDVWSLFGNLTAPLFQSGRLKGERQQSQALLEAEIAQYRNTVLNAFSEVEIALANEANYISLINELQAAADENKLAEDQSWKLYERGLIDITSVLDAQRRSFESRNQLISANNSLAQNRIDLILALGGDFETSEL